MTAVEFVVLALAANQVIEIWNHGSICCTARNYVRQPLGLVAALLNCPFCLGPWVGAVLYIVYNTLSILGPFAVTVLAIAGAARWINDLGWTFNRTPHFEPDEQEGETAEDSDTSVSNDHGVG